jgi:hypothetical protein
VAVHEVSVFAGATIGQAVVGWPARYASDASMEMGKSVRLRIGSKTAFRGVVGQMLGTIDPDDDSIGVLLYDDKWLLNSRTVGQVGIGTQGGGAGGFADVGFQVVFNRAGAPNKNPDSLDFNTGSTAVYWTCKTVLQFLFAYYVPDGFTLDASAFSAAYDRAPTDLDLRWMKALDAIDTVVSIAGESWGLTYQTSGSTFVSVRPGAGDQKRVRLFAPKGGARAESAGETVAQNATISKSIRTVRDRYQAVSAPVVKEHTYCSIEDETWGVPLLVGRHVIDDAKY